MIGYFGQLSHNAYKARTEGDSISTKSPFHVFEYLLRNLSTMRVSVPRNLSLKDIVDYVTHLFLPNSAENKRMEIENKPQNTFTLGITSPDVKQERGQTYRKYGQLYAGYKKAEELWYRAKSKANGIYKDLFESPESRKKLYEAVVSALRKLYNPFRNANLDEKIMLLSRYLSKSKYQITKVPEYPTKPKYNKKRTGGLEELLATT